MCTVCPIIHCFNGDSASHGPARKPDPNLGKCLDSNNNKVDEAMLKNSKIRDGVSRGQEREDKDEEEEDERCQLDSISNGVESGRQQSPPQPYRRRKNFYQRWTTSSGTEATNIFFSSQFRIPGKSTQWKGSDCKQSARWQHVSRLKASAFCIW